MLGSLKEQYTWHSVMTVILFVSIDFTKKQFSIKLNCCCCCCYWSPSRSMTTLHYYLVVLCWGRCVRRWLCSPNWEAQVLPQWGHCGPVFGFVVARHSSEAASQLLTKCARPASQVAFHTTRSLARVSRSHGLMRHLHRFILMWSI